jgi:DNA repair exonuclease SbcCD ATPase subunit
MEHKKLSLELKELEDSASKIKEKIKYLSIVVDMLGNGGIKSRIIDGVLPFLQSKAQSYLDLLSDSKIRIEFSTTKELKKGGTKNELMVHAHNSQGSDAYYGNSAGEKQRIDLAIGWALGDLAAGRSSKKIRLKVCDEIFTHIDATGADAIFKLLNKAAEDYDSVFCITHDTNLQTQFNKTITVVKRGGSTYLSEESQ